MNANDDENNAGRENEAHEIPADPSVTEDDHQDDRDNQNRRDDGVERETKREEANNEDGYDAGGVNDHGEDGRHPSAAGASQSQMFNHPNNMMYPNANNDVGPQQFFPTSDAQYPPFDPSSGGNAPYGGPNHLHHFPYSPLHQPPPPHHMNNLPPNLPPMLPPPPSMSIPSNNNGPSHLDATRQYYEARMREHAMQYANAAAGAAWAAARIACGGDNHGMPPAGFMGNSYYTPAPAAALSPAGGQQMVAYHDPNQMIMSPASGGGPRQKRTLWHPPSSPENKSKEGGSSSKVPKKSAPSNNETEISSGGPKPKAQKVLSKALALESQPQPQSYEKKRSKKRESGNDSVSSLGSESRELNIRGHPKGGGCSGGERSSGKQASKTRRRFNDGASPRTGNPAAAASTSAGGKNIDNYHGKNHNLRQKRGGSFSSHGSGNNPHHTAGGRNKKKNRSQPEAAAASAQKKNTEGTSNIFLGGLVGKNGVRALHELCSKYRWEMPKYISVEPASNNNDGNSSNNNDISFVLTVHVNGVELGRGRGGTKSAAKQDASRKALAALVPGVVFDPNGILLDVGSSSNLLLREGGSGSRGKSSSVGSSKPLSLDELGPHLASQLAIGGGNNHAHHSRPHSPDHSADSSISTALSEEVFSGAGPLISGGPLSLKLGLQQPSPSGTLASSGGGAGGGGGGGGRFFAPNIYPCASTTSGVSSASEDIDDEDENAYYSSRGASVCSTLLHAMWQIDDRIREPPSYTFDLCPSPVTMKGESHLKSDHAPCPSKRKKVEPPREVATAGHRMFQCVASLNLYFSKSLACDKDISSIMECWESPLDYLQSNEYGPSASDKGESSQSRKRKDSMTSQSTQSPNNKQQQELSGYTIEEQQEESLPSPKTPVKKPEKEDCIQHKLESTGTGSTKRESKHKASAKLLAALFPGCSSMVEVKAEAEAARELYAANKAAMSQTKRAKTVNSSSPQRKGPSKRCARSDISLHALTLSEMPKEGMIKRIKWSDSTNNMEVPFENEVDAALQSLQELDEEWAAKDPSPDDVGKIILRRALCDDADHVYALLNKNGLASTMLVKKHSSLTAQSSESLDGAEFDEPCTESDTGVDDAAGNDESANAEENKKGLLQQQQLDDNTIILVLSRAVALHDPPLGCAILKLSRCSADDGEVGRSLALCRLGYEEHLPRERFIECLDTFASNVRCSLDDKCSGISASPQMSIDEIRSFLSRSPPPYQPEDVDVNCGGINGNSSSQHRHLQSVKEEDSEEVDDGSEGEEDSNNKVDTPGGGSGLMKGARCCKPSKRSRVA